MEDSGNGGIISDFHDLRAYRCAMDLVMKVYTATEGFPEHEVNGLRRHIRAAIVRVPAKIANGHAREDSREFVDQISISEGYLAEVESYLEAAGKLGYLTSPNNSW